MENQNQQINIDLFKDTEPITCPNCGNDEFQEVIFLRRLSVLFSPTGKPELIPIKVLKCNKCGEYLPEFKELVEKLRETNQNKDENFENKNLKIIDFNKNK